MLVLFRDSGMWSEAVAARGRLRWCRTEPARAAPGDWRPPRDKWRWCLKHRGHKSMNTRSPWAGMRHGKGVGGWTGPHLFLNPPSPGCRRRSCRERRSVNCGGGVRSSAARSGTYPWTPFLGGLLLNWRVCLCLNLGGPLRGVAGPPLTRVADLISALGSRFILPAASGRCPSGVWSWRDLYGRKETALVKQTAGLGRFYRLRPTVRSTREFAPQLLSPLSDTRGLNPPDELTAAAWIYAHISIWLSVWEAPAALGWPKWPLIPGSS